MHNPPHPGLTLRDDVLPALGMTVTDAAQALGVTRPTLSLLTHQPKSFDWRERNGRPHPWGTGHVKLLAAALKRFDTVFGICNH
jgi:hypothetical protein